MSSTREISSRDCETSNAVTTSVVRMFDLADRKYGFTLKVLHLETEIPEGTLRGWIAGTSSMPLAGFVKIAAIKGFPNELLSLVFEAPGKVLSDAEPDEADFDDMAVSAAEFVLRHLRARHPNGPGGVAIIHSEKPDLKLAAGGLVDRAGKVAGQ